METAVLTDPRVTRKGNGILATSPAGSKVWFAIDPEIAPRVGEHGRIRVTFEDRNASEGIWFLNGVCEIVADRPVRPGHGRGQVINDIVWKVEPQRSQAKAANSAIIALPNITHIVGHALGAGAKRLSFRFKGDEGAPIKIHWSPKREALVVTDGRSFGDNEFYGYIKNGEWRPTGRASAEVVSAVRVFDEDPAKAAKLSGQATGECCFCGRFLETNESVNAGYGPICADRYGLPWGDKSSAFDKVREEVAAAEAVA